MCHRPPGHFPREPVVPGEYGRRVLHNPHRPRRVQSDLQTNLCTFLALFEIVCHRHFGAKITCRRKYRLELVYLLQVHTPCVDRRLLTLAAGQKATRLSFTHPCVFVTVYRQTTSMVMPAGTDVSAGAQVRRSCMAVVANNDREREREREGGRFHCLINSRGSQRLDHSTLLFPQQCCSWRSPQRFDAMSRGHETE